MTWHSDAADMLREQRAARMRRKSDRLYSKAVDIIERSERAWAKARDLGAFDKEIIG